MFEIHFRKWRDNPQAFSLVGKATTLEEARDKRCMSGDLVVHAGTHRIVKSQKWLWDWEQKNSDSYAQRAIRDGV